MSTSRISRRINAPRSAVYRALLDARAVEAWRVPDGMISRVHELDAREGGRFRVSLVYDAPTGAGKTSPNTDTYHSYFAKLVPDEQVVEVVEFETDDPTMRGEMRITTTLCDVEGGTKIAVAYDGLPPGLPEAANETGTRMALAKLAALVEREGGARGRSGSSSKCGLRKEREASTTAIYVQYGCGFCVGKRWLNFDSSPTLRIERLPVLGRVLGRIAGNSQSFPDAVRYGDICKGLPVQDNSAHGVYASHVLEHLAYEDFKLALQNTFRILKPGGLFRLIVPDLQQRARRYVQAVADGLPEASLHFMRASHLGMERKPRSTLGRLRLLYGGSAHLWMWDEPSMVRHLEVAGFVDIQRCEAGDSEDAMFMEVEDRSRFIDAAHNAAELAIAARKPV